MPQENGVYRFGPFTLDAARRHLLRGSQPVKLYPKEFDTLLALVERSGRVVDKDELLRRVWPDAVVEEGNLTTYVSHLRKVLGGAPERRDYIVTIPGRGYQFVAAVATAPDAGGAVPSAPGAAPRWRAALAGSAAAAALIVVLVATRAGVAGPPRFQQLTFQRGTISSARFAPDGHTVVYSAAWNGEPSTLFSTRSGSPESRSLGHAAELLSISPAGELAVALDRQYLRRWETTGVLARVPLDGGVPRAVLRNVKDAEWSADAGALAVVRRRGSSDILEFPIGKVRYEVEGFITQPRVARTGGAVAFLQRRSGDESVELLESDGTRRTLAAGLATVTGVAWSASGTEVLFTVATSGSTEVRAVTLHGRQRVVVRTAGEWTLNDVAPDGRALMTQHHVRGQTNVGVAADGGERDLSWLDRSTAAALSDDGTVVVLAEIGAGGGPGRAIYVRGTNGSPAVRLGEGEPAALSPDRKWIAAIQGSAPERLVLLPTATGEPRTLPNGSIEDYYRVRWLPDNRRLVFGAIEAGKRRRIYIQNAAAGDPQPVSWAGSVAGTVFLPDGKTYVARGTEGYELAEVDGRSGRLLPHLTLDDYVVQTAADGRSVFVVRREAATVRVDRVDLDTGRRARFKEIAIPDRAGVSHTGPEFPPLLITPDGRTYVYSYIRTLSALYLIDQLER